MFHYLQTQLVCQQKLLTQSKKLASPKFVIKINYYLLNKMHVNKIILFTFLFCNIEICGIKFADVERNNLLMSPN